jgi:hypothetical protein
MTRNKARKKAQRAAAAAYGEPLSRAKPHTVWTEPPTPRVPCPDGCQSQYRIWQSGTASMVVCAWCDQPVCVDCQRVPVADEFARCPDCDRGARVAAEDAQRLRDCVGRCDTQARAWEQDHPGLHWDGGDSATAACEYCPNAICVDCHKAPARYLFGACPACERLHAGYWMPWETQSAAELTEQLQQIIARIGRAGGGPNDRIVGWINRQMGVKRRADATEQQLWYGIEHARRWLTRLHRANNAQEPGERRC